MSSHKAFLFAVIIFGTSLEYAMSTHYDDLSLVVYGLAVFASILLLWEHFRTKKTTVKKYNFQDADGYLGLEIGVTEDGKFTGATPTSTIDNIHRQAVIREDGTTDYTAEKKNPPT